MKRINFVFLFFLAAIFTTSVVLALPNQSPHVLAQNASPTPVQSNCRDLAGAPCSPTPPGNAPGAEELKTGTEVPLAPPVRSVGSPVPSDTPVPTASPTVAVPGVDDMGEKQALPFNILSPDLLPRIIAIGLFLIAVFFALIFGRLLFGKNRLRRFAPRGNIPDKGWSEIKDFGKIEPFDKDHKGWSDVEGFLKHDQAGKAWSELSEFPKVEQEGLAGKGWSDLSEFPKVEQGGLAGKGWSELNEFPKVEHDNPNEFIKHDQGDLTGKGWSDLNEFPKVEGENPAEFLKHDLDGLDGKGFGDLEKKI